MSSLKDNKTCALLDQYLSYLTVVKGRSPLTADEYRVDNNVTHVDGEGNVHYVHGNAGRDMVKHDSRPLTDINIRGYVTMFQ